MLCTQPFVRDPTGRVFKKALAQGDTEAMLDGIPFPCGQCLACRINRRRVWTHRLMLEALDHESSSFITLTYADEFLPISPDKPVPTLCKRDAQLFLKRLRKRLTFPFRYYLCGEYGGLNGRPHYHAILFGVPAAHAEDIDKAWSIDSVSMGRIDVQEANQNNIQYVAGYVTKKMSRLDNGLSREFSIMSRKPGIGTNCIPKMVELFTDEKTGQYFNLETDVPVLMHGKRQMPLGRFLTDKLRSAMDIDKDTSPYLLEMFYKYLQARDSGKYFGNYLESILIDESKQRNLQLKAIHKIYQQRSKI